MMVPIFTALLLFLVPPLLFVRGAEGDVELHGDGNSTSETAVSSTAPEVDDDNASSGTAADPSSSPSSSSPSSSSCKSCDDGCPNSNRVYLGLHEELVSAPPCPEGGVATVTRLRTLSANNGGRYDVITWNPGSYSADFGGGSPYVYRQASEMDQGTTCYEVPEAELPVVGDQREIKVTLNCEAVSCDFRWDVEFGCAETGVTVADIPNGGGVQVLSDVDDTVTCSDPSTTCDSIASCAAEGTVSHFLAGVDRRLEHKEMYPGVAELMLGLALGPGVADGGGNGGRYYPAKPVMLSARPREAEAMLAIDQDSELNVYLEAVGQRTNHTTWGCNVDASLYGTVFDGTSFKEFGETKAKSYNRISSDLPATRFAFLGDNGQGDVCAAQSMLESENGDRVVAVFIHVVQPPADAHTACESPDTGDFALDLPAGVDDRVHYFGTYPDAALWALRRDLISCCSASNVHSAVSEWIACRCEGSCPEAGCLPTGVCVRTVRNETFAYCDDLRDDLELLAAEIRTCDVDRTCPTPLDLEPPKQQKPSSAARGRFGLGNGKGYKYVPIRMVLWIAFYHFSMAQQLALL